MPGRHRPGSRVYGAFTRFAHAARSYSCNSPLRRSRRFSVIGGILVAMMIATFRNRQIGARGWLRTFIASLVPLGTFANDQWLKRLAEKRT